MTWIEETKNTVDHTEETKNVISWIEEIADWFYHGWFLGWFSNKSAVSHTEETKNTVSHTEETKNTIDWTQS